jgi:hypothetical protein
MKKTFIITAIAILITGFNLQDADEILKRVEQNLSSDNRIFESTMTIHGARTSRTITSRTYAVGDKQSFTEYLSPAREQGTKMLKQGEGTEFRITSIKFNQQIPDYIFTKASLKQ